MAPLWGQFPLCVSHESHASTVPDLEAGPYAFSGLVLRIFPVVVREEIGLNHFVLQPKQGQMTVAAFCSSAKNVFGVIFAQFPAMFRGRAKLVLKQFFAQPQGPKGLGFRVWGP